MKYADDLVLLANEETVIQGMTDCVCEIERYYGTEVNVGKIKVLRVSWQSSPVKILIQKKQLEDVEYFNCLGGVMTNYVHMK